MFEENFNSLYKNQTVFSEQPNRYLNFSIICPGEN